MTFLIMLVVFAMLGSYYMGSVRTLDDGGLAFCCVVLGALSWLAFIVGLVSEWDTLTALIATWY